MQLADPAGGSLTEPPTTVDQHPQELDLLVVDA
jgi:hypothetical protein